MLRPALVVLVLACVYRVVAVTSPALANFSPLMALTFCAAVFCRDWRVWLLPLAALSLSDLWLNFHYAGTEGYHWDFPGLIARTACFAAAIGIGAFVARHRSAWTIAGGALAGSALFYLVTNSVSWAGDPYYAKTLAGWWQALTIGHPEFPSTLYFFRNTLVSDLAFTGAFTALVVVLERRALQSPRALAT